MRDDHEHVDELTGLYEAVATHFKMLSEPTRLRILHAICAGEKTVSEIVDDTGASQTNVSRHLNMMHQHGVLLRRKAGSLVYYRPADPTLMDVCRGVCERIALRVRKQTPMSRQMFRTEPARGAKRRRLRS
jgi:DNA-binding transcriptional ArsR family regulator